MSSYKPVCKYFSSGTCRFGNRCQYLHPGSNPSQEFSFRDPSNNFRRPRAPYNPDSRYVAPSYSQRYPAPVNQRTNPAVSDKYQEIVAWAKANFPDGEKALDILQQLQKEARVWMKSSLWRFTSRSIYPGGHSLPDWTNMSFEEVKWEYYVKKAENQEHRYKKVYSDYWETTERHLVGLAKLKIETLEALKPYIQQCIASGYQPAPTLRTDVEMNDGNGNASLMAPPISDMQSRNYTPDDLLLEDERKAFQSDSFMFGQIPIHAPSVSYS